MHSILLSYKNTRGATKSESIKIPNEDFMKSDKNDSRSNVNNIIMHKIDAQTSS